MTQAAVSNLWQKIIQNLNQICVLMIAAFGLIGLYSLRDPAKLAVLGWSGLVGLGVIGIWRWLWFGLHLLRSWIYQNIVFVRWRRRANAIPIEDLPPVCLLVPTYKEKPWITKRVFRAIAEEAKAFPQPIILVTVSSGPEEDADIVRALQLADPELSSVRIYHVTDPGQGKRKALAEGLRELARLNIPEDAIVALMDGDSVITPGTLRRCLPFFVMFPKLGALTTDEVPVVSGSYVFSEWFHLRFSQRHYQMCSISLSKKVLCLTGRFSLYRSEAALHPNFAEQLENDMLNDWLWGQFKFLSGDDKTTWYWLLRHRKYDLLYIPDVVVYSIETVSGSLFNRMYQNMRRWFGNMLRNGNRALALGPQRTGLFVWLCLLDQRLSMWTCLVSPCLLLVALFTGKWYIVGVLLSWLLLSRSITLTLIFWNRESTLKPVHLPLLLISQWSSAMIKIWTLMNLAQQRWFNRGDRKLSADGNSRAVKIAQGVSKFILFAQIFSFGVLLFWVLGMLSPVKDVIALWNNSRHQAPIVLNVNASEYGVIAGDDKDDAAALQALVDGLSQEQGKVRINLPIGELLLSQPIFIHRSQVSIVGQGVDRTVFNVAFDAITQTEAKAVMTITPSAENATSPLENVHLQGFSLRPQFPISGSIPDSILLNQVTQSSLRHLRLEPSDGHSIVLQNTKNVVVEYVALEQSSTSEEVVLIDAIDTDLRGSIAPSKPSNVISSNTSNRMAKP
ncbi:glycosyltransferase [Oscillatoria sp. FACHB-1407]|uniref:glycosyltransferase n=1 Tax=Oscillatoria sp. FACHB-1407 TaxID=2692847 RepID=UPI0016872076|nr:glycosyltransferase [Oscillatoria sp. FACHB-1407]MBD2461922.1 glycosyltransferase [Oscillatoria sp. FACHB-1407]